MAFKDSSIEINITVLLFTLGIICANAVDNLTSQIQSREAKCQYQMCAYVGDPHLLPFSQPSTQYYCGTVGWELLVSNQYITLHVLVSQYPYLIIDVQIMFF